mgnify:CR=1 FL=1
MTTKEKLAALRRRMRKEGLSAYLIPSTDPHQSEYVPACWRRREFISGFTGSAGDVVVTLREAGLWTDSRYWLQAERELAGSGIELFKMGEPGVPAVDAYLQKKIRKDQEVGVDPQVLTKERAEALEFVLKGRDAKLKLLPSNLVDDIWADQPPLPADPVIRLADRYAGEKVSEKLKRLREQMKEQDAEALVISALDAVAWTFNMRGTDVQFNPLVIAHAIVGRKSATLFVKVEKLSPAMQQWLGTVATIEPYEAFGKALRAYAKAKARVWVDPGEVNRWTLDRLKGARLVYGSSPVQAAKAVKNRAEQRGMRRAHVQDGIALVRFLNWLESVPQRGRLTEVDCIEALEGFRSEGELYQGPSFAYISSWKTNGAVIHYDPTKTDRPATLKGRGLYLFDSGGQYLAGTTDVTRTICFGDPTDHEKACFTRVLKGVIALSTATFPEAVQGGWVDALARKPLWDGRLNYRHGTGHGVGSFLCVHEGPVGFSPRNSGKLGVGNVLTIEPGHYEDGKFGIRIENMVVLQSSGKPKKGEPGWLECETLTLCPIDVRLVEPSLMNEEEIKWLNGYHSWVRDELAPHLDSGDRVYLELATRPI